jgi:hypothetical protein
VPDDTRRIAFLAGLGPDGMLGLFTWFRAAGVRRVRAFPARPVEQEPTR